MLSLAGPRYIFIAKPTCQVIYKSLQSKAPPYLSSLVTIATAYPKHALQQVQWGEQLFDTLPILKVLLLTKHVEVIGTLQL